MFLHIDDKRAEIVIKDYATDIGLSVLVNESPNGGCLTVHYEVADLSAVDGHTINLTIDWVTTLGVGAFGYLAENAEDAFAAFGTLDVRLGRFEEFGTG